MFEVALVRHYHGKNWKCPHMSNKHHLIWLLHLFIMSPDHYRLSAFITQTFISFFHSHLPVTLPTNLHLDHFYILAGCCSMSLISQAWWLTTLILELRRLKQELQSKTLPQKQLRGHGRSYRGEREQWKWCKSSTHRCNFQFLLL